MSVFIKRIFPSLELDGIAKTQTLEANDKVILNGQYATFVTGRVNFSRLGFIPTILITIQESELDTVFTVVGKQNNKLIIEEITIPAGELSIESTQYYDEIHKITVAQDVVLESIECGFRAFFPLLQVNLEKKYQSPSYAFYFLPTNCTYQVYASLEQLNDNYYSYLQLISNQKVWDTEFGSDDNLPQYLPLTNIVNSYLIHLTKNQLHSKFEMQFLEG